MATADKLKPLRIRELSQVNDLRFCDRCEMVNKIEHKIRVCEIFYDYSRMNHIKFDLEKRYQIHTFIKLKFCL